MWSPVCHGTSCSGLLLWCTVNMYMYVHVQNVQCTYTCTWHRWGTRVIDEGTNKCATSSGSDMFCSSHSLSCWENCFCSTLNPPVLYCLLNILTCIMSILPSLLNKDGIHAGAHKSALSLRAASKFGTKVMRRLWGACRYKYLGGNPWESILPP